MQLVIFDMGGVMIDGFDVAPQVAARLGMSVEELRRGFAAAGERQLHEGTITVDEFWQRFLQHTGVRAPGELWGEEFTPVQRPAMYALAERIKAAGYRLVAGTNTIAPHYDAHVQRRDYDVFDHVYASHLMHVSKPDAAFWEQILSAEGVAPAEALFVDDLEENVVAARGVGLTAVRWVTLEQAVGEVERVLGVG